MAREYRETARRLLAHMAEERATRPQPGEGPESLSEQVWSLFKEGETTPSIDAATSRLHRTRGYTSARLFSELAAALQRGPTLAERLDSMQAELKAQTAELKTQTETIGRLREEQGHLHKHCHKLEQEVATKEQVIAQKLELVAALDAQAEETRVYASELRSALNRKLLYSASGWRSLGRLGVLVCGGSLLVYALTGFVVIHAVLAGAGLLASASTWLLSSAMGTEGNTTDARR